MNDIILAPALQDFSYFQHKMPLYLQKSYGYIEHFRLWFNILTDLVNNADDIYDALDVFNENYVTYINSMGSTTENAILDMIGNLIGISRFVRVGAEADATLTNEQFIYYIRMTIAQQFCDGSAESILQNYERAGLKVFMVNKNPAQCGLVLNNANSDYDITIQGMFRMGLFTFKSAGINYIYSVYS